MRQITKIAFVGSHGVGKTTLLSALKEALSLEEENIVEETATKVFELGKDNPALQINQGATLEAQLHIIGMQLEDEDIRSAYLKEVGIGRPLLVCDRSVLDAVVYTYHRIHGREGYPWAKTLPTHLFDWAVSSINTKYDKIFYLPIEFPLTTNEVRPGNTEFQECIDFLMQDILIGHRLGAHIVDMERICNKVIILSGSPERRLRIVRQHLNM